MLSSFCLRVATLFAILTSTVWAAPKEDLVASLPLFGKPPTPQYSGYLDGTDGCDTATNGPFCKLHYWFAEAEEDPYNKPVILWLNGGPGSSSILGFLQENGPLLINATGGLMQNPWAWTKVANLFVLESPVGVGYSYCANQIKGDLCENTDKYTASTTRAALADFFRNKFPDLSQNDFFITGESYAGVYIPTLAKEILEFTPGINLVGLAVGGMCVVVCLCCTTCYWSNGRIRGLLIICSRLGVHQTHARTTQLKLTAWTHCGTVTSMDLSRTPPLIYCGINAICVCQTK